MVISVVIPVYNHGDLLVQTLQSVLRQERHADEIIVVDDGSTEDLQPGIQALGASIIYIRQDNAGQGAARNRGAIAASGDAICFLDADDNLLPGALAMLEKTLLRQPEAAAAVGGCELIDQGGAYVGPCPMNDFNADDDDIWFSFARSCKIRTPGCVLVRRSSLLQAGNWDISSKLRGNEDWEMWLRLVDVGTFAQTPEIVLQYRQHPDSTSARLGRMLQTSIAGRYKHRVLERNNPRRLAPINEYLMTMTFMAFYVLETGDSTTSGWSRGDAVRVLSTLIPFIPRAALARIRYKMAKITRRVPAAGE